MKTIVITAPAHPILSASFTAAGYNVIDAPDITKSELLSIAGDIYGIVVTTRVKVDRAFLNAAKCLKWIGRLGSGMELIDTDYATERGILYYSTPEGNCTAVGEHALMLLLSSKRHLLRAANEVNENLWRRNENRGTELQGKRIGIIGFGHTGSAFASALAGLGVEILAYDKYRSGFHSDKIVESTLDEIKDTADVISFHLPLAEETNHFFDMEFATALKKRPLIINTSRGAVIDELVLLDALKNKLISGAALDVLEHENIRELTGEKQMIFAELQKRPDVLITPHIAGYTEESYYKMSAVLLKKLGIEVVVI